MVWASVSTVIENPKLLQYVRKDLPHEGILEITREGFLYVQLPKEYVFQLIPFLSKDGAVVCPPPYFQEGKVGAHITVATVQEMAGKKEVIPYLRQKVFFSIMHLEKVDLENGLLGSKVAYLLTVQSSQIAEIRKKLGLADKIQGYDFHITIAVDCLL